MHLKGTRPLRAHKAAPLGGAPSGCVVQAQDLLRRVISGAAARTALVAVATRLADSSGGQGRVEAGQAAGSGSVQRVSVSVGVQADQVEREGGEDVSEAGPGQAAVAGVAPRSP